MSTAGTSTNNMEGGEEVDLKNLQKLKSLIENDPNFIPRLISQLDNQMKSITEQKMKRLEQIKADEEEMKQIDKAIAMHVKPNLEKLSSNIQSKALVRDEASRGLVEQTKNLKVLEKDAAALLLAAKMKSTKLNYVIARKTAADRLSEARGFNCTTPTTELLKGTKKKAM